MERDTSTGESSSISEIYKNILKTSNPICMLYFSHPFGISTPSSVKTANSKKPSGKRKGHSKYTTTTYLVTEIQKNCNDDADVDRESREKSGNGGNPENFYIWPKSMMNHEYILPPLLKVIERYGKKLPDIEAILKEVRKTEPAWKTPKSTRSRNNNLSCESSLSSFDLSSSPDRKPQSKMQSSSSSNCSSKRRLLKRRYSVPEIIMRRYSLAQQKSSTLSQKPTNTSVPFVKYSIPFYSNSDTNISNCKTATTFNERSMLKNALLKTTWKKEKLTQQANQQSLENFGKRQATVVHHQQQRRRLNKFISNPECLSQTSCEKCKNLSIHPNAISFDETLCRKDSSSNENIKNNILSNTSSPSKSVISKVSNASLRSNVSSVTSDVNSGVIDNIFSVKSENTSIKKTDSFEGEEESQSQVQNADQNGNHIPFFLNQVNNIEKNDKSSEENLSQLEVDENYDNNNSEDMKSGVNVKKRLMKLENVIESDDDNNVTQFNYKVLREDKLSEGEVDQLIAKLLIDNLNNVINTVNENLQGTGQKNNLVQIIDYKTTNIRNLEDGGIISNSGGVIYSTNNKKINKHENQIQKNEDNIGSQNLNELNIPILPVRANSFENTDVKANNVDQQDLSYPFDGNIDDLDKKRYYFSYRGTENEPGTANSNSYCSDPDIEEIGTLINTGSSYKEPSHGESILIPRLSAFPRTESMEVQPSTSEQTEEEFDEIEDVYSDDDELSLVDSLDDFTIRMNKISRMQLQQERQQNNFYKPSQKLKAEAYFVPLVDTEQQLDEHFPLSMPDRLKERLILRQRRREMKRHKEMKMKQWQMHKYIERRIGDIQINENEMNDFNSGGGSSFKVIPVPIATDNFPKRLPLKKVPSVAKKITFKPESSTTVSGGWKPKPRNDVLAGNATKATKSKRLRSEIGMLESYTIDGRGNMKIQPPSSKGDSLPRAPISRRVSETKKFVSSRSRPLNISSSENPIKKRSTYMKSTTMTTHLNNLPQIQSPTSSSERFFDQSSIIDARKKQVMKDVNQMSNYSKSNLTPDPESGPIRKMWKTEIQEDKYNSSPKSVPSRKAYTPGKSPKVLRKTSTEPKLRGLPNSTTPKKILPHAKSNNNIVNPNNIYTTFKEDKVKFEDQIEDDEDEDASYADVNEFEEYGLDHSSHQLIHQFLNDKIRNHHQPFPINNHYHYHLFQMNNFIENPTPGTSNNTPKTVINDYWSVCPSQTFSNSFDNCGNRTHSKSDSKTDSAPYNDFTPSTGSEQNQHQPLKKSDQYCETTPFDTPLLKEEKPSEKIIKVEMEETSDNHKKQENFECNCIDTSIPYHCNEKNVWQVFEITDCSNKLIQTKMEHFHCTYNTETKPKSTSENTESIQKETPSTATDNKLSEQETFHHHAHSRSTFDENQIVSHNFDRITTTTQTISNQITPNPTPLCVPNTCDSCCFCNPNLHTEKQELNMVCSYCKSKTPQKEPSQKNESINIIPIDKQYYETLEIHEGANSVSTTCTKIETVKKQVISSANTSATGTSEAIKKINSIEEITSTKTKKSSKSPTKLLNRPKETNMTNQPRKRVKSVKKEIKNEIKSKIYPISIEMNEKLPKRTEVTKTSLPKVQNSNNMWNKMSINNESDDDSLISSSSSSSSSTHTILQRTNNLTKRKKSTSRKKSNEQSDIKPHNLESTKNFDNKVEKKTEPENSKNEGWTVTVAGSWNQEQPDLEMRLSFPKNHPNNTTERSITTNTFFNRNNQLAYEQPTVKMSTKPETGNLNLLNLNNEENSGNSNYQMLPATFSSSTAMKKRALARGLSTLPPFKPASDSRKGIKRVDSSIITSNLGKRSTSQYINERTRDRDQILMANSSRRMSLDSRLSMTPSDIYNSLSVVGSEMKKIVKPRVLTMSEKDLTKRHHNCFTRTNYL